MYFEFKIGENFLILDCDDLTNDGFNRYISNETLTWKAMASSMSYGDYKGSESAHERAIALR